MSRTLLIFVSLCLAVAPQLQQATGTGFIGGRVIEAQTGRPIAGASIYLSQSRGGYRQANGRSDAAGTFSFDSLAPGSFSVTAVQDGFVSGAVGKRRLHGDEAWLVLGPGSRRENVSIVMFRSATVSGRVVDERGNPVAGVRIHAWPRERRSNAYLPSAATDRNGVYRISGLVPDDYVVALPVQHTTLKQRENMSSPCVPPPPGIVLPPPPLPRPVGTLYSELTRGFSSPSTADGGSPRTYRTTYYPGAYHADHAEVISLGEGAERPDINFELTPALAATVRGRIMSSKTLAHGGLVNLLRPDGLREEPAEAVAFMEPDGTFTMLDVPVGNYVLQPQRYAGPPGCDFVMVDQDSDRTRMPVDVSAVGLNGLVVELVEGGGVTISGQVVLAGTSPLPNYINLGLGPDSRTWSGVNPRETLRFVIPTALPGMYEVHASDNAVDALWWLESVTINGRDITGAFQPIGAVDLNGVVITMTDKPARLSGVVTARDGRGVEDATVLVFPTDRMHWKSATGKRFKTARALEGQYTFEHLLAGDYLIAAVDETTMDDWPSPAFLERVATHAQRITVRNGIRQTLALTLR